MVIASVDSGPHARWGIHILDGDKWKTIGTEEGLADNMVFALAFETDGTIWAATGKGLTRIDPCGQAKTYTTLNSGLPFDHVTDLCLMPDRTLWVATNNGVGRFTTG